MNNEQNLDVQKKKEEELTAELNEKNVKQVMAKSRSINVWLRIVSVLLIIELAILVFCIITYSQFRRYSECSFNVAGANASVYLKNNKTNKLKLTPPNKEYAQYSYPIDAYVRIEEEGNFRIEYEVECSGVDVQALLDGTDITKQENKYVTTAVVTADDIATSNGKKVYILSGIVITNAKDFYDMHISVNIRLIKGA